MAKRLSITDPFAGQDPSVSDVDEALYGKVNIGKSGRVVARPTDIYHVHPDPVQPRRAVPSVVRARWDGQPATVGALLSAWIEAAAAERMVDVTQIEAEINAILSGEGETARAVENGPEQPHAPIEAALLAVVDLAASIRQEGLTNPITVVEQDDEHFQIETGERRWLAYHLLNLAAPGEWDKIPARTVDGVNVWRQAAENNAREELNAIARARQVAVLIMDIYRRQGHSFQPPAAFPHEQDFYAQVADGNAFRVPRGFGEKILTATGLKNAVQIRQYRQLLRLSREEWQRADDLNLTEYELRSTEDTVTAVTVAPRKPAGKAGDDGPDYVFSPDNLKRVKRDVGALFKLGSRAQQGDPRARAKFRDQLDALERWLDEARRWVDEG